MAMSAIANGGRLLEPILVEKVTDGRGETIRESSVHVRREAIPPGVARTVAEMLTAVTEDGGTAVEAAIPGYASRARPRPPRRSTPPRGSTRQKSTPPCSSASFPSTTRGSSWPSCSTSPMIGHYGGDLAGPVFRRVAESSLRYLGVTPSAGGAKIASVKREGDPATPRSRR